MLIEQFPCDKNVCNKKLSSAAFALSQTCAKGLLLVAHVHGKIINNINRSEIGAEGLNTTYSLVTASGKLNIISNI